MRNCIKKSSSEMKFTIHKHHMLFEFNHDAFFISQFRQKLFIHQKYRLSTYADQREYVRFFVRMH